MKPKMAIKLKEIPIRKLFEGYVNNDEEGVLGYGGKLNIRPKYQREYIYKDKERNAVIDTVMKGFPLNVMYWADNENRTFEVLDGQQRILSICKYLNSEFSIKYRAFHNLTDPEKKRIMNYELLVYFCKGDDEDKLDWFQTINIAGLKLSDQELRNAVYCGSWVTDAKRYFSKTGCPAFDIAGDYVKGVAIRQEILETAIEWINGNGDGNIRKYMSKHQKETHATPLWNHFETVINWTKNTFPKYEKGMKGVDWGELYRNHKNDNLDPKKLQKQISKLMADDEVTNKKGIYPYVLNGDEKNLHLRIFSDSEKKSKFKQQGEKCASKKCPNADKTLTIGDMEADHIKPWSEGGKTEPKNLQVLCRDCNRRKGAR